MKILAIETSCDETAAAVVENGTDIIHSVVASSKMMHEKYGGIVPEVAAREQLKCIIPTINEAMGTLKFENIDAIAVTIGPGLIGSLLIGVETAKTIAFVTGKPLIPVNHVLAHMYANFVTKQGKNTIEFPALSLVVSGGHTELYLLKNERELTWLGGTLDDAAGEAFDKTARLLGFGHGGGIAIQDNARNNGIEIRLPRPLLHDGSLNFSFSGLKTAILREVRRRQSEKTLSPPVVEQLAFEVQEAITDVLVAKAKKAAQTHHTQSILLSGGVAANLRLRQKLPEAIVPPVALCTDNAVYIASYAFFRGKPMDWHAVSAMPDLSVEG